LYPKRLGHQHKGKAISALKVNIKSKTQFDDFKKAVENYATHIRALKKERTEFVCQFRTFCSAKGPWIEWINPTPDMLKAPSDGQGDWISEEINSHSGNERDVRHG
jgi:hypothetical protein